MPKWLKNQTYFEFFCTQNRLFPLFVDLGHKLILLRFICDTSVFEKSFIKRVWQNGFKMQLFDFLFTDLFMNNL